MDPNENLKRQLVLAARIHALWDACNDDGTLSPESMAVAANAASELAELVDGLDGWMAHGGFLPARWDNRNRAGRIGK